MKYIFIYFQKTLHSRYYIVHRFIPRLLRLSADR